MSRRIKLLVLCHGHPRLYPGGTEIFAHDLFQAIKRQGAAEGLFVGCATKAHRAPRAGAALQAIGDEPDEAILWAGTFDRFFHSQLDLHQVIGDLGALLTSLQPDVVHLHHTLLLGIETVFLIRRTLPNARIVLTLHDYYLICANDGQMVKTQTRALCRKASPADCQACFPERGADRFRLRNQYLKSLLGLVDAFAAPSRFLRDRFVAWGLPADRITVIPNGLPPADPVPDQPRPAGPTVFGLFGNLTPYKGVTVALEAVRRLAADGRRDFRLRIHGDLALQAEDFRQTVKAAADAVPSGLVEFCGAYQRSALPGLLMAVDWVLTPSIWWENAPLVIQEAFRGGRPVICSGIGGMAEMVQPELNGLYVQPNDPGDLAATLARVLNEPDLHRRLAAAVPPVPSLDDCARAYLRLYRAGRRRSGNPPRAAA